MFFFLPFYLAGSPPASNWFFLRVPWSKSYSLSDSRCSASVEPWHEKWKGLLWLHAYMYHRQRDICTDKGLSLKFHLICFNLAAHSATLGWFLTLNGAKLVPYISQLLLPLASWGQKKKSPVFIFLLRISTVQRVYSEEINVTVLRKGKRKHRRVSHQSSGWEMEFVCASDSSVREGVKSKNLEYSFKEYLFSNVSSGTIIKVWRGGMTLKEPALSYKPEGIFLVYAWTRFWN